MNLEEVIDTYNRVRERCTVLARKDNGKLMDEYAWLRNALIDTDIVLEYTKDGIRCFGTTYTCQTMDNEFFDFLIPFSELD